MVKYVVFSWLLIMAQGAMAQTAAPILPAPLPVVEPDLLALAQKAHPVVQGVMAVLAGSVFVVLTVLIYKQVEISLSMARLKRAMRALPRGPGAVRGTGPLPDAARMAEAEIRALPAKAMPLLAVSARERLALAYARIEAGEMQRLRFGTGILASIGSVGPFIGLFGTVFGIMNSFLAIAATRTTNLAVVAPGIAEALLATGLGLVAAIPAVLVYNHLMRRLQAYRHRLADGMAELLRRFSHALDDRLGEQNGRLE